MSNNLKEENKKNGWFSKLRDSLKKTRSGFTSRMEGLFAGKKEISDDLLDELEEILISSDLGIVTCEAIIKKIKDQLKRRQLKNIDSLKEAIYNEVFTILDYKDNELNENSDGLTTTLVIGVNGSGKTTTIAKLAYLLKSKDKKVILAAGDTFRAAATEQLSIWADRTGADILKHKEGADPSAVVFDAASAALSRKADYLLIDTAGRLHSKKNLLEELKKIKRVLTKVVPGSPDEILLVLDAVNGQNALVQARTFHDTLGITGLVLTKLDSSAKGGAIVGIVNELKLPLKFIGVGEGLEDLRKFETRPFVDALFATE